jgi:hypothetical protein
MIPLLATVPLDPPTAYVAGAILMFGALRQIRREQARGFTKYIWLGGALGAVYGLTVLYQSLKWPDWMWVYWFEAPPLWAWYPPFVVACFAGGILGALSNQRLLREGRIKLAIANAAAGLAVIGAMFVAWGDQYIHVGTRSEYLSGAAPLASGLPEFTVASIIIAAGLLPPALGLLGWLVWKGRKEA